MEFASKEKYKEYLYSYIDKLHQKLDKGIVDPFEHGKVVGKIDGLNKVIELWDTDDMVVRLNKAVASFMPGGNNEGFRRGAMTGRCEIYAEVSAQFNRGFDNKKFVADNNQLVGTTDPSLLETEIYIGGM